MSAKAYRDIVKQKIARMLGEANAAANLKHMGLRGDARVAAVRSLLSDVLPETARVGSGVVVDHTGSESNECDLLIYAPSLLPSQPWYADTGIYPVDSCIVHVEVKSRLTATELADCVEKGQNMASLQLSPRDGLSQIDVPVLTAIVAFGSDLVGGKTEFERLVQVDTALYARPAIHSLLVVGKGFWRPVPSANEFAWAEIPPSAEHDEVIDFLGVLVNGVNDMITSRQFPKLGTYIINPRPYCLRHSDGHCAHLNANGECERLEPPRT